LTPSLFIDTSSDTAKQEAVVRKSVELAEALLLIEHSYEVHRDKDDDSKIHSKEDYKAFIISSFLAFLKDCPEREDLHGQTLNEIFAVRGREYYFSLLFTMTYWFGLHMPFMGTKGELGVIPINSERGDEVWYIFGCSSVMTLQPHEDRCYSLVGEAYLDGYNYGELYEELAGDSDIGDEVRDITIQRIIRR
jgi:hypothetical protein